MTKSKSSANSAMEASPASTTSDNSISNESTTTPSSTATPVSTTSAINVATSNTTSTKTSASTAIPNAKVTSKNTDSAIKETKEKKPAPPTSSAGTDAVPIESSSPAPALTTATIAKMSAMDTTLAATETVPTIKETSTIAMDKKSASKQDDLAEAAQEFVKPKVIEKVLELPVVNDTYDSLVKLSSPLNPYVEKIGTLASPVVDQALDLTASIEGKVPDVVQASYTSALNKAATMAASLDATLCSGVDNLVEKVPALKQATPALYNSTRDSVGSYVSLVATYMASFTIAQVFLKAADLGLETTDGLLKLTANQKVDPILTGLRRVRSEATSLRKEGIVLNGTAKAKILEEATLIGAMFEIFGLGFFFNQPWNSRGGADDEGLPDDDDAIDIVSALPSKTRSGLVL